MVIASKVMSIGIIVMSLAMGLVTFYLFSDLPKKDKKKYIEVFVSQIINFIILVWVGKIIFNISLFIQDPLAVLAYPGDSAAFYFAVLLTSIVVMYQHIRKRLDLIKFAEVLIFVFLIALFFYEFLQMVLKGDVHSFGYLVSLVILLMVFFWIYGRVTMLTLLVTMLTGWTIAMVILSLVYPFVAVFGYLIEVWFILALFIGCLSILILNERKRKRNGAY